MVRFDENLMFAPKVLVLGAMPADADPATHIAAGPWCFAGRENVFPDWEKRFVFAPEPLADPSALPKAARFAQILCVRLMPDLARLVCADAGKFPPVYWQILLEPWAMDVARQIVERSLRCQAMLAQWRDLPFSVELLPPDCVFNFASEHDFTLRGGLGLTFNHWLFSRILEMEWPTVWQKKVLPAATWQGEEKSPGLRGKIVDFARLQMLKLPFPRLKGMTSGQALLFSASLLHTCQGPDGSLDLDREYAHDMLPDYLHRDFMPVFKAALPLSIKKLRHSPVPEKTKKPRLRVASIAAYENAAYRQTLARHRACGHRIAYAQHGGNYGQVAVACDTQLVEYSQDAFFTWGWSRHGNSYGNFIPMPAPQLSAIGDAWKPDRSTSLLFVGTEMAAYGYRLDSRPTPLQFLKYRQAKAGFFGSLSTRIREKTLYRPYFPLPGVLEDWEWLSPRFPELQACSGPLLPKLLSCRLLVLDHHGTTMLEAMAANVPMVLYWDKACWPLVKDSSSLLDMLEDCGIWHPTPEKAAAKVEKIWNDAESWWRRDHIQQARQKFCEHQARWTKENLNYQWIQTLRGL